MVEIVKIERGSCTPENLEVVVRALKFRKLVIYPTETVYGLGVDATSDKAVAKVFEAKSRPLEKPISVAVDSLSMAYRVGKLNEDAEDVIQEFLPGPLTLLVDPRPILSELLFGGTSKVGIRIPDHFVALKLIEAFDGPITSTSANKSGEPSAPSVEEAVDQIGHRVDYAVDSGGSHIGTPTTVLDLTSDGFEIVREGPISKSEIEEVLE
ncbi:MAG: L-threonylcarbamoyladenylate synthase [Candidatus Hadarchaeia archaeon]